MAAISRFLTLLFGGLFLLMWVVVCAGAFWFLYTGIVAASPDRAISAVEGMMWPFTVTMLGLPLIVLLAFGGLRIIRELVELQKMVADFPQNIHEMQGAVTVFKTIKNELVELRGQIVTEINLASSEIGQTQTVDENATTQSDSTQDADVPDHVKQFEALYQKAKRSYKNAVRKYSRAHPEDENFNAGGDWIEIVKFLRDKREGYFDEGRNRDVWYANWVIRMIETERSTRKNRVARLSAALVADLADDAQPAV
jgi:hypothetical protein